MSLAEGHSTSLARDGDACFGQGSRSTSGSFSTTVVDGMIVADSRPRDQLVVRALDRRSRLNRGAQGLVDPNWL